MSKRYHAGEPQLSEGKVFYPVTLSEVYNVPFLGVQATTRVYDYCTSRVEAEKLADELNKKQAGSNEKEAN